VSILSSAYSLECWSCSYSHMTSDNVALKFLLETFSKISNEECQLLDMKNDQYNVDIKECEPTESGKVAKCATVSGTVHASFKIFKIQYKTVERGCVIVDEDDPETSGTQKKLPSYGPVRDLLDSSFESLNLGDVTFDGTVTYTTESTALDAPLRCYRCTHNDVETNNKFLQWVIDGILLFGSDACLLDEDGDSNDDDKYEVAIRNCRPPTDSNFRSKCARVKGTVTGSIPGKGDFFINFKNHIKYILSICVLTIASPCLSATNILFGIC
jgi:hypothetical protein